MTSRNVTATVLAAAFACLAGAAAADRIDGDWCAPGGLERITIDGPNATITPGIDLTGTYTRHEFFYVVPEGAEPAGAETLMRQLSEERAEVYRGEATPVMWTRCPDVVS